MVGTHLLGQRADRRTAAAAVTGVEAWIALRGRPDGWRYRRSAHGVGVRCPRWPRRPGFVDRARRPGRRTQGLPVRGLAPRRCASTCSLVEISWRHAQEVDAARRPGVRSATRLGVQDREGRRPMGGEKSHRGLRWHGRRRHRRRRDAVVNGVARRRRRARRGQSAGARSRLAAIGCRLPRSRPRRRRRRQPWRPTRRRAPSVGRPRRRAVVDLKPRRPARRPRRALSRSAARRRHLRRRRRHGHRHRGSSRARSSRCRASGRQQALQRHAAALLLMCVDGGLRRRAWADLRRDARQPAAVRASMRCSPRAGGGGGCAIARGGRQRRGRGAAGGVPALRPRAPARRPVAARARGWSGRDGAGRAGGRTAVSSRGKSRSIRRSDSRRRLLVDLRPAMASRTRRRGAVVDTEAPPPPPVDGEARHAAPAASSIASRLAFGVHLHSYAARDSRTLAMSRDRRCGGYLLLRPTGLAVGVWPGFHTTPAGCRRYLLHASATSATAEDQVHTTATSSIKEPPAVVADDAREVASRFVRRCRSRSPRQAGAALQGEGRPPDLRAAASAPRTGQRRQGPRCAGRSRDGDGCADLRRRWPRAQAFRPEPTSASSRRRLRC